MPQVIKQDDGTEVEVYTADEMNAQRDEAIKAKEEEFGGKLKLTETERDEARKALGERTSEFQQFRKLNEEQKAKLTIAEQTIYRNQELAEENRIKQEESTKKNHENIIESTIRAKAGNDEKLFAKLKDTYSLIGIDDSTVEGINARLNMAIGALTTTAPDMLANIGGFSNGSFVPKIHQEQEKNYADTEAGQAVANELGLKIK